MSDEAFSRETADFEAIEAAVMETERGRWFLKEFARRNRNADSLLVLEALDHLNRLMKDRAARARTSESRDGTAGLPGPGGAKLVLRDAAAGIRHAISRIESRRDAWRFPADRTASSDGAAVPGAAGSEALGTIDDILRTLRGLEARIATLMAAGEPPPADLRAAEIARLKDEMMRDAMPSVPYLM